MNVWVTGASGMLGRVLVPLLRASGWDVTALSRTGRNGTLALDLCSSQDVEALIRKSRPAAVLHGAALADVDACERDPDAARAANAFSTRCLARACSDAGAPLIYVSTDYVFDGKGREFYGEDDPTFPVNLYGLSKLEGEWHAATCRSGGAIVRTSWLFGAPNPANFVNAVRARLLAETEVSVLDDQTDSPTSVLDLSRALEAITRRCLSAVRPITVYHFCNAGSTTRLGMTLWMRDQLKAPARVVRTSSIPNRPAVRPPRTVMSCGRFEKDFGVRIRPWQEALREYLESESCGS